MRKELVENELAESSRAKFSIILPGLVFTDSHCEPRFDGRKAQNLMKLYYFLNNEARAVMLLGNDGCSFRCLRLTTRRWLNRWCATKAWRGGGEVTQRNLAE